LAGASWTAPATVSTGTTKASTLTIADTSKLRVGDSINGNGTALTGAKWIKGSTTLTVADTATLHVGDTIVGGAGIPYGTTVVSITSGTECVLSAVATAHESDDFATSKGQDLATIEHYGTVASITDSKNIVLTCSEALLGTATVASTVLSGTTLTGTLYSAGSKVYPPGNSYSAVKLAFGDATVVLSKRPSVDSFGDVTFALGTNYTQASKVGDVKISFNEGDNFTYYGTDGVALAGIPLSAAESNGPKIRTFNVGTTGAINVILSNGQTFTAGSVLLQTFKDPGALTREGDNLFSGIITAGPYNGDFEDGNIAGLTPSNGGLGAINGGSLELSNVDLGEEFSTMITTQRAFQAGSRVITTTDQMLEEAVNLKR